MDVPVWIRAIFAREYDVSSEPEIEAAVQDWLKETGDFRSFDAFFESLKDRTGFERVESGESRSYSIRNYHSGDHINCNGLATISAVKGVLEFDKSFEVIIEYEGGQDPETGQVKKFRSHVSLYDGRNNYGGLGNFNNREEHPQRMLALLYLLSDAYVYWHSGERDRAKSLANQIEEEMEKDEALQSEYIYKRIHETRSNINF